jgi:predicted nucleic acid-binding protein
MPKTVPAVTMYWSIQVADGLQRGVRSGVGTQMQLERFIAGLYLFQFEVDRDAWIRAWSDILPLALQHNLSVFDAAYIELAVRRNLPLATSDPNLTRAATSAGVPIFTP